MLGGGGTMQRDRLEDSFGQLELVLSFYQGALTAHLHAERAHDSIDNKGNFSPPTSSQSLDDCMTEF